MAKDPQMILKEAKTKAKQILSEQISDKFIYHDEGHTERVVQAAKEIGEASHLTKEELEIVELAAWFHDTGYRNGCDDHEHSSVQIAREFLKDQGYPESKINRVEDCILDTRVPQKPQNLLEEVLCDADLYHLACVDYKMMSDKMHQEIEQVKVENIDEKRWNEINYAFFKDHEYFTDYAKVKLQPIKEANLESIEKNKSVVSKGDKQKKKLQKKIRKLD